jgi:Protein of unknown function (DUF2829)
MIEAENTTDATDTTATALLNFSEALELIKEGELLKRLGWNGAGMFVFLVKGSAFAASRPPLNVILGEGAQVSYEPHIDMRTEQGSIMPWIASQSDLLANDWAITSA